MHPRRIIGREHDAVRVYYSEEAEQWRSGTKPLVVKYRLSRT